MLTTAFIYAITQGHAGIPPPHKSIYGRLDWIVFLLNADLAESEILHGARVSRATLLSTTMRDANPPA